MTDMAPDIFSRLERPMLAPTCNADARATLTLERVLDDACLTTGLSDFGNLDFLTPLQRYLECVLSDLEFTPSGLITFTQNINRILVNRLRFESHIRNHPEILDEDVSDPIVITGMPRTGTTKLQRVLSADPGVQALWIWRVLNPAPFPSHVPNALDSRIMAAKAYETANESTKEGHEILAEAADEDIYLLAMSLDYFGQVVWAPSQSYLEWQRTRPRSTAYYHEKKMLQYLQWQDGGKKGRRWILKGPTHIGSLDILLEVFPRAFIVNSTRNIEECFASNCDFCESVWSNDFSNLTPRWIGWHALALWVPEFVRAKMIRSRLGTRSSVLDVSYVRVVANPVGLAEEIYGRIGIEFSNKSRDAMTAWCDANSQYKYGRRPYSLEKYGLTPELIRSVFPGQENISI